MSKNSKIFNSLKNDPYGLLKGDVKSAPISEENRVLISMFEEVQDFVEDFGCEPESNMNNINEFKLHSRLNAIRSSPKKVKLLKKYDFKNLLKGDKVKELTIEAILENDPFGLMKSDSEQNIFNLRHVKSVERIQPEYLSRRKICPEFSEYKEMFQTLHKELSSEKRRLIKYSSSDLSAGYFYALNGILFYLKSIEGDVSEYTFSSGERARFDGRTLCIFDNGTQSDMLFRSLDKAMQLDGYSISRIEDEVNGRVENESDILNGYIYVLRSCSKVVQEMNNVFKIGFTTSSVIERIKNAKKEATYLFSDVEIVSTFRCLNVLSHDIEQQIHDFFTPARLDIELHDSNDKAYHPREWFQVDLVLVEEAIGLIVRGDIQSYEFDKKIQQIVKKQ